MHCGNPFDLRGAMHGFNSSVRPQALELRNDERHGNHKCDPVGKGRCPCDTGNADSAIQNQHEHHVQTALAKKRQAKRLHLLADRLKDGDDHKIDRGRRAGKAADLQKMLPVLHRLRVRNEASGDGRCQCLEKNGTGTGNEEAVRKRRPDRGFHPLVIAGGVVVADQRQRSLRHILRFQVQQLTDLQRNIIERTGQVPAEP